MRVEFHTDVAEPVAFACRLLRKAYRAGARLAVFAPAPTLARLDDALWTFDAHEFVPHARWTGEHRGLERTPIWLVGSGFALPRNCSTAINLGLHDFESRGFERLVEIVSTDAASIEAARVRWRRFNERGAVVTHYPYGGDMERGTR